MRLFVFLMFSSFVSLVFGQEPYVIGDKYGSDGPTSVLQPFISLGGKEYFVVRDSFNGDLIWVTDGTTTEPIESWLTTHDENRRIQFLGLANDKIVYLIGTKVWLTDGTQLGTVLLNTPEVSQTSSFTGKMLQIGGFAYINLGSAIVKTDFSENGSALLSRQGSIYLHNEQLFLVSDNGTKLYRYDHETDTDELLAEGQIEVLGNTSDLLYFKNTTQEFGNEVWRTDGTVSGTQLILDIYAGSSSNARAFSALGNLGVFQASDADGLGLWKTDGSPEGTIKLMALESGISDFQVVGQKYFFSTRKNIYKLFVSDGSVDGTVPLSDFNQMYALNMSACAGQLFVSYKIGHLEYLNYKVDVNSLQREFLITTERAIKSIGAIENRLFFASSDANYTDEKLFVLENGRMSLFHTFFRASLRTSLAMPSPEGGSLISFHYRDRNALKSLLYQNQEFIPFDVFSLKIFSDWVLYIDDQKLWYYRNGVTRFVSTSIWSDTPSLEVNGHAYWSHNGLLLAMDGATGEVRTFGQGVLRDHAMVNGHALFAGRDCCSPLGLMTMNLDSGELTPLFDEQMSVTFLNWNEQRLFFTEASTNSLWVTDGTLAGSKKLGDFTNYSRMASAAIGETHSYFFAFENNTYGLWASDGSENGAVLLKEVVGDYRDTDVFGFIGDKLFFKTYTAEYGDELWVTDGTPEGTVLFKDFFVGPESGINDVELFTGSGGALYNGQLYFSAYDGVDGFVLWRTDGTLNGTEIVHDPMVNSDSNVDKLTVFGGRLYFVANSVDHGRELWSTDGTPEGLRNYDIYPGKIGSHPDRLVTSTTSLFFRAFNEQGRHQFELNERPIVKIDTPDAICPAQVVLANGEQPHPMATYLWVVTGGTIVTGQNTPQISYTADSNESVTLTLSVTLAGVTTTVQKTVLVDQPITDFNAQVIGASELCEGEEVTFGLNAADLSENYLWTFPNGWTVISGQGESSVVVKVGRLSGQLRVIARNTCGDSDPVTHDLTVTPLPRAFAGGNLTLCGSEATLNAATPTVGTGLWRILSGQGGHISEPTNPQSSFQGVSGETYELQWEVTGDCGVTTDNMLLHLLDAVAVSAGEDQVVCGLQTNLAAETVTFGTGLWTIVSGSGGRIENRQDPHSEFTGQPNETYVLAWDIEGIPCEVQGDQVRISFHFEIGVPSAGNDFCSPGNQAIYLNAQPTTGGHWVLLSAPGGGTAVFEDITDPRSFFTPESGAGEYRLAWRVAPAGCEPVEDILTITVLHEPLNATYVGVIDPFQSAELSNGPVSGFQAGDRYFFGSNSIYGAEPMVSDGTKEGTFILRNINPNGDSVPRDWTLFDGNVFFLADNGNKTQLWTTDGTVRGTVLVRDVQGEPFTVEDKPVIFNDKLFFKSGALWELGSRYGTPHPKQSFGSELYVVGDQLHFSDFRGVHITDGDTLLETKNIFVSGYILFQGTYYAKSSSGLWKYDPADLTFELFFDGFIADFEVSGQYLYFLSGNKLWRTDGFVGGTRVVNEELFNWFRSYELIGTEDLLLIKYNGHLYATDGTAEGTELLVESVEGSFVAWDNYYWFVKSGDLWRTNKTAEGTAPYLEDGSSYKILGVFQDGLVVLHGNTKYLDRNGETLLYDFGFAANQLRKTAQIGGRVAFLTNSGQMGIATDQDVNMLSLRGVELIVAGSNFLVRKADKSIWLTDGTDKGTFNIIPAASSNSNAFYTTVCRDRTYFKDSSLNYWCSDGTLDGTFEVPVFEGGWLYCFDEVLSFTRSGNLWLVTDQHELTPVIDDGSLGSVAGVLRGALLFTRTINENSALWRSDGTISGTYQLQEGTIRNFIQSKNRIWFSVGLGAQTTWVTDGTVAGTRLWSNRALPQGTQTDGRLLYYHSFGSLYAFDGIDIENAKSLGRLGSSIKEMTSHLGRLWVVAETLNELTLWQSNGTSEGTFLFASLGNYGRSPSAMILGKHRDKLFFNRFVNGENEVYFTDGSCLAQSVDLYPEVAGPIRYSFSSSGNDIFIFGRYENLEVFHLFSESVRIPDPVLHDFLLATIDGDENEQVSGNELSNITSLDLRSRGVTDLKGIESMPQLTSLNLENNQISDLSPLVNNPNLGTHASHEIYLNGNSIAEDQCEQLLLLMERVEASGATLVIGEQIIHRIPGYEEFPQFTILDFLNGVNETIELECAQ